MNEQQSDERKRLVEEHYRRWRERYSRYADDVNRLVNPLRRDTLEMVKESASWARLGMQYAIIVNAGALGALPYPLGQTSGTKIDSAAITFAAYCFAVGMVAAALCCLVAYLDFQFYAAANWSDLEAEMKATVDRHLEFFWESLRGLPSRLALWNLSYSSYLEERHWSGALP